MGMAASQARLLTITARLNHIELEAQNVSNAKIRLSDRTQEASDEYIEALNKTEYLYNYYDGSGAKVSMPLTGAALTTYGELKNQYGLINPAGQILVSELDAKNYESSNTLEEFLEKYGVLGELGEGDKIEVANPEYETAMDEYDKEYDEWLAQKPDPEDDIYQTVNPETNTELYDKYIQAVTQCGCWTDEQTPVGFGHVEHLLAKMLDYDTDFTAYPGTDKEVTYHKLPGGAGSAGHQGGSVSQGNEWKQSSEDIMVEVRERIKNLETDPTLWQDCVNLYYEAVKAMRYLDAINSTDNGAPVMSSEEINLAFFDADESDGWDSIVERLKQAFNEPVTDWDAYNDDLAAWEAQEPEEPDVPMYIEKEVRKITDLDKAQWYVNLWHRMNGTSDYRAGVGGDENFIAGEGWATKSKTEQSYAVLKDGDMNSPEYLKFAIENGLITLEQVQFIDPSKSEEGVENIEWTSIVFSAAQDITEQKNEEAITKAEVKYEQAQRDIQAKDKEYETQMKKLDTEHNALQTEYDSIKSVIEKNVERSFKAFS